MYNKYEYSESNKIFRIFFLDQRFRKSMYMINVLNVEIIDFMINHKIKTRLISFFCEVSEFFLLILSSHF